LAKFENGSSQKLKKNTEGGVNAKDFARKPVSARVKWGRKKNPIFS
jgi:hypothetical protein